LTNCERPSLEIPPEDLDFILLDAKSAEVGRDRLRQKDGIPASENLRSTLKNCDRDFRMLALEKP